MRLRAVALALLLVGCPGMHAQEREQNAIIGAGHQAALEQCLANLDKDLAAGVPDDKAWENYQHCADSADADYKK